MTLVDDLQIHIDYVKKRLDPEGPLGYKNFPPTLSRATQPLDDKWRITVVQAEVAELERFVSRVWNDLPKAAGEDDKLFRIVDEELRKIWLIYNQFFAAQNPQDEFTIPLDSKDTRKFIHTRKRHSRGPSSKPIRSSAYASRLTLYVIFIILLFVTAGFGGWKFQQGQLIAMMAPILSWYASGSHPTIRPVDSLEKREWQEEIDNLNGEQ